MQEFEEKSGLSRILGGLGAGLGPSIGTGIQSQVLKDILGKQDFTKDPDAFIRELMGAPVSQEIKKPYLDYTMQSREIDYNKQKAQVASITKNTEMKLKSAADQHKLTGGEPLRLAQEAIWDEHNAALSQINAPAQSGGDRPSVDDFFSGTGGGGETIKVPERNFGTPKGQEDSIKKLSKEALKFEGTQEQFQNTINAEGAGYTPEDVEQAYNIIAEEKAAKEEKKQGDIENTRFQYVMGNMAEKDVRKKLDDLKISSDEREALLSEWHPQSIEKKGRAKNVIKRQVNTAERIYKKTGSEKKVRNYLTGNGYDKDQVNAVLREIGVEAPMPEDPAQNNNPLINFVTELFGGV